LTGIGIVEAQLEQLGAGADFELGGPIIVLIVALIFGAGCSFERDGLAIVPGLQAVGKSGGAAGGVCGAASKRGVGLGGGVETPERAEVEALPILLGAAGEALGLLLPT